MSKTQFDLKLYHQMYQLYKISTEQGVRLYAESLSHHFEIPDRTARYYFFMVENNYNQFTQANKLRGENRLVIPDIHAPFTKKGFLEHCVKAYHDYHCTKVTYIGDVIDNHYSSAYTADPDGLSAKDETDLAIEVVQPWFNAFPEAEICIGNHDLRIRRQAFEAGISEKWIKDYSDVMQTPGWVWADDWDHFDVRYTHGDGPGGALNGAFQRMLYWDMSVVQGHWHTSAYTRWKVSEKNRFFAHQMGCGIDRDAYAMAYGAKSQKKLVISCSVILDNGRVPVHLPMYLGDAA